MPYKPKHRGTGRSRGVAKKVTTTAAVTGAAAALPVLGVAGPAQAATGDTWNRLAQCESSGDWHINTGNGYYGGIQFSASTWQEFGGGKYASRADLASRLEQIAIAEKVLDVQGWNAWPACSAELGLGESDKGGSAGSPASQDNARSKADTRSTRSAPRTKVVPGATYVVRSGDTLGKIAKAHNVKGGWRALWKLNRSLVGDNPNLIFPDEKLRLG